MNNVVIWGAGKNCSLVVKSIRKDRCNLIGIIDSDEKRQNERYEDKWKIFSPNEIRFATIDYVVISVQYSTEIMRQCDALGIDQNKIIDYWKTTDEYDFIDLNVKKIYELERELEKYKCRYNLQFRNLPYELGMRPIPDIRPADELLEIILKEKKSLCRFGDGELEVMRKKERLWYQETNDKLAERLKEVFNSNKEFIIIALPDNFGNLEKYTEDAAYQIRAYLDKGNRESLMTMIDQNRVYYDSYVSRPYIIYQNKKYAGHIFKLFKQIWSKRDVLIIEGSRSYTGVRNDLLEGANNIQRIIAPSVNSFAVYDKILFLAREHATKDMLILVSLGPAATVLAYDLALEGIQALDIGQLDNEYEWFLRKVDERVGIPGKCVAELNYWHDVAEIKDVQYEEQVIARIEE